MTAVPELPAGVVYTRVAAGDHHTLLVRSDGAAVAFGASVAGELLVPKLPKGLRYTGCAAGSHHSVLLRSDVLTPDVVPQEFHHVSSTKAVFATTGHQEGRMGDTGWEQSAS